MAYVAPDPLHALRGRRPTTFWHRGDGRNLCRRASRRRLPQNAGLRNGTTLRPRGGQSHTLTQKMEGFWSLQGAAAAASTIRYPPSICRNIRASTYPAHLKDDQPMGFTMLYRARESADLKI